jgi:hypothetical protein
MSHALFSLAVALAVGQSSPPKTHPLAPSLPLLSKDQYARFTQVIDRFILADTGKLKGEEAKKALAELNKLGPEAVFQLLEGFNKAARMEDSCPAVIIGRKLSAILRTSNDIELVTFAKENIGLDVKAKRHMGTIRDLQLAAQLRRATLARQAAVGGKTRPSIGDTNPNPLAKPPKSMTVAELADAIGKARDLPLKNLLVEIEKREGPKVPEALGMVAGGSYESDVRELAQSLLTKHVARQKPDVIKSLLKHERSEVRAAAAAAAPKHRLGAELIDLLNDDEAAVRREARAALVRLSGGADHGPSANASASERAEAIRQWRQWWAGEKRK